MKLNVLVVSEERRLSDAFDCLRGNGFDRVYHTGFPDAIEQYRETAEDGWDVVVIDDGKDLDVYRLAQEILKWNPKQLIMLVSAWITLLDDVPTGLLVPRNEKDVWRAFQRIGGVR